ncbi:hypothetical protein HPB47_010616 [Ixodes persulcatus]|uniref:Uncharacterized protein n=1 Tax=Ixodes persulcatus TaxID=34615 RepID=A0AC60NYM9_IXOPE|nr:hypothetical protein HPB47_010616 [Ixodes persulcatus]
MSNQAEGLSPFQALESAENTQPEEAEETALKGSSSYAAALKRPGKKGRQSADPSSGNPPEPTRIPVTQDDLDTEIAQLSRQIELLRQRKARVAARHSTTLTTVDEDQPTPDIPLLKLWAERRQAELQANRNPLQPEGRVLVNHITARARRHEKQLSRCRWYGWCDSLGSGAGNKALWRTFRAMERGGQQADLSASIRLALNLTPDEFAKNAAVSFFPNHQQPPIDPPSNEAMDTLGLTDPFTKAELIAAIEATKKHSSPGYDNIPYELFKNLEGEAIAALLQLVNQREQARILKRKHIPAAAALHSYFYGGPPLTATLDDIPPWCYTNITTNKTTKLRRSDQPAPTPETSIPQGQCVVYTDAAVLPRGGRVAFVSPSHPGIQATCNYKSDTPDSLLLELQAIHDAIKAVIAQKNLLRRDTRALIPPCVCSLPRNLSRVEEVSLRRLRAGAALTPSVTWTWGHTPADPGTCPKCQALVATADAHHLLWLCSGTKTTRWTAERSGLSDGSRRRAWHLYFRVVVRGTGESV